MAKFRIFHQYRGLTRLKKSEFFDFFKFLFLYSWKNVLFLKYCQRHFLAPFAKNKNMAKFHIFAQNHGLTPLKKSQFFDFFNFSFLCSWKRFLFVKYCQTYFFGFFCEKWKHDQISHFWPKPWTNPFEKFPIFRCF